MLHEYNLSTARANLTEIVDHAQQCVPSIIKPRKKSEGTTIVLNLELLNALMKAQVEMPAVGRECVQNGDGSVTVSLSPLGVEVKGRSSEEAVEAAVTAVMEYASDFLDPQNARLFLRAPSRRSHAAFVLRILLCRSRDEVKDILGLASPVFQESGGTRNSSALKVV